MSINKTLDKNEDYLLENITQIHQVLHGDRNGITYSQFQLEPFKIDSIYITDSYSAYKVFQAIDSVILNDSISFKHILKEISLNIGNDDEIQKLQLLLEAFPNGTNLTVLYRLYAGYELAEFFDILKDLKQNILLSKKLILQDKEEKLIDVKCKNTKKILIRVIDLSLNEIVYIEADSVMIKNPSYIQNLAFGPIVSLHSINMKILEEYKESINDDSDNIFSHIRQEFYNSQNFVIYCIEIDNIVRLNCHI